MPVKDRRERLEGILARENEKRTLNSGYGSPKLRDLKLSNAEAASGSTKLPPKIAKAPSQQGDEERSMFSRECSRPNSRNQGQRPDSIKASGNGQRDSRSYREPPGLPSKEKPKGEWTLLRQFEHELSNADQITRRKMEQKDVLEHRAFLDHQRLEKEQMMEAAREAAEREARKMKSDLEKWGREEQGKRQQRKHFEERTKQEQQMQLDMIKARREADLQAAREQEEAAVALAKRQVELDKELERRKKHEQEERMRADMKYMDEMIRTKEAAKVAAKQADRTMMAEYARLLEEQDIARETATAAMFSKASERSHAAGGGIVEERNMKKQEEQMRLKQQEEDRWRIGMEREMKDEERKEKLKQEQLLMLEAQLNDKKYVIQKQQADKRAMYKQLKDRDEYEMESEQESIRMKRERNMQHKMELIQQMHINREKEPPEECMTHQELLINAPLVARAREILT